MASDLRLIYRALAAMPVGAAGVVPTVYGYDALPQVNTANTPARLQLPFGTHLDTSVNKPLSFGGKAMVMWKMTDLLLWSPIGQGVLSDHAAALLEYVENYINALAALSFYLAIGGVGGVVEGWTIDPGIFEYPAGSGAQFFGVEITLSVKETI
jgi:hypothetical protein